MTEKRFTLAYEKGNWWAVRDGDITLWKEEVISLLNALHEENEQLRKDREDLFYRERDTKNEWRELYVENQIFRKFIELNDFDPDEIIRQGKGDRMTEKRFKIIDKQFISYYGGDGHQISDGDCKFWLWHNQEESQKVCDKLNSILDENEQLKQFKEDVFAKIDMHLRMLPTARDNEFNEEDGDPSLYSGAIYMLETLKKELEE